MQQAEFNHEDFEQTRQAEQDETLLVKFYTKAVRDISKSEELGRAVFTEREYVDIRIPGQRGTGAARPATRRDKSRFPKHYAAFRQRVEMPIQGTPLAEWPAINRSFAEELSFLDIKTVEQLSNLADVHASQFMGGQSFKAKAKEWLARAKQDVTVQQLEGELDKRDKLIADMAERLEALEGTGPAKVKRKRRTKEEIARDNDKLDTGQRPTEPGSC